MLFDLRSRRRRGAVRVIYLFLAVVMVAGLVLVGVGTGSGGGGLLNAFTNSGSGGGSSVDNQAVNSAVKAVKKNPSPGNWAALMQARLSDAGSGNNYNSNTDTYTASGKKQLRAATQDWQQYLKVTNDKPTLDNSFLAAGIYQSLGQWAGEVNAWNYAAQSAPKSEALKPYLCLALSAYAAKQKAKGELAAGEAVSLAPKLQRLTLKSTLSSAKSSATTAEEALVENC